MVRSYQPGARSRASGVVIIVAAVAVACVACVAMFAAVAITHGWSKILVFVARIRRRGTGRKRGLLDGYRAIPRAL